MVAVKVPALVIGGVAGLFVGMAGCGSVHSFSAAAPASHSSSPASAQTPRETSVAASVQARAAGGPVPRGFAATSVTFVSADEAFVLGTAPCAARPCTSVVHTLDRGVSWRGLPAPVETVTRPTTGTAGVWGIRFANPRHGFVFGNGLWETTDGGARWTRGVSPGGSILALAVLHGQVLALTTRCSPGESCAPRGVLVGRPLAGGAWSTLANVRIPPYDLDTTDLIATQAGVGAVLDGSAVLVTSDGGHSFTRRPTPCTRPGINYATSVAVTSAHGLALLCVSQGYVSHTSKRAYVSADGGARWSSEGVPNSEGDAGTLGAANPRQLTIATASAASWLYYSADSAARWQTTRTEDDGGVGWADLGFTTAVDGVVVHAPAFSDGNSYQVPGQLLLSGNAGLTWQAVRF